ncbi:CHAP domain-containing protein [Aurantimicrobium minutum]|nr:CHAP domain-containing protein [Aurantimicrobium minutum]
MSIEEFFSIPSGTNVFNNGADQCVALANLYEAGALQYPLPSGIQSAFQWWTEFSAKPPLVEFFIQVSENPKRGDIFVGRYGPYQAENGHIGVVERDWDGSTFGTMETGYWSEGKSYVKRLNRTMDYVLGFLRPKVNIFPTDEEEQNMIVIARTNAEGNMYVYNLGTDVVTHIPDDYRLGVLRKSGMHQWDFAQEAEFKSFREWYKDTFSNRSSSMSGIDTAAFSKAIAKAVNDEIAKRMSS